MSIEVKFFASLAESLGRETASCPASDGMTARSVWDAVVSTAPDAEPDIMVAINWQYADWQTPVVAGDEVAFFPTVTGG